MARVLVTGGAGFIGSHLVDMLLQIGHEVRILDNYSTGSAFNLMEAHQRGARSVNGSVTWRPDVDKAFEWAPEVVYHLAAQVDVRESAANPARDADVNVIGTLNVLQAAERMGVKRFVFVSSSAVFGDGVYPIDGESGAVQPISPYGASKAAAEIYIAMYGRMSVMRGYHGAFPAAEIDAAMRTTTVLFGNVYGPRQRTGAVPAFIGRLLRGEAPTLYGDGWNVRDYVFVADAVRALLWAGCCLGGEPDPLNSIDRYRPQRVLVGTGVGTTDMELVEAVAEAIDATGPEEPGKVGVNFEPARPCDIGAMIVQPTYPGMTGTILADGIRATVEAARQEQGAKK